MSTDKLITDREKIEFVANLVTQSLDGKTSLIDVRYVIDSSVRFHWITEHGKGVDPVRAARAILQEESEERASKISQHWLWWVTTILFTVLCLTWVAVDSFGTRLFIPIASMVCLPIFWVCEAKTDEYRNSRIIQTDQKPVIEFYDWVKRITDGIQKVAVCYSMHNTLSLSMDFVRQFARDSLIYQAGDVLIANYNRNSKGPHDIELIRLATVVSEKFEANHRVLVHECHLVKDNNRVLFDEAQKLPHVREVLEKTPTPISTAASAPIT